jgi:hypothetical protein
VYVPASSSYERFTSSLVYSSLQRTRIASFNVSPRHVSTDGRVTMTGRLERHGRSWSGYAHQKVLMLVRLKGQKEWGGLAYVRSNSRGYFSYRFRAGTAKGRVIFAAYFLGNSKYLWSLSSQVTLTYNGGAVRTGDVAPSWGGYIPGISRIALPRLLPVPVG